MAAGRSEKRTDWSPGNLTRGGLPKKDPTSRITRSESDPRWRAGDQTYLAESGAGADTTQGQVNIFLDCVASGEYRWKESLAAAGITDKTWRLIQQRFPVLRGNYDQMRQYAAQRDEDKAIAVLEDGALNPDGTVKTDNPQMLKYLSDGYRWRASVRDRKRYGEKTEVEQTLHVGVMLLPAESWGAVPTTELAPGGEVRALAPGEVPPRP